MSKLLGRSLSDERDFDVAEDELRRETLKRGFYVLMGRTPPLRELMLCKKLTAEQRQINLPEAPQSVRVSYLDDLLEYFTSSNSWTFAKLDDTRFGRSRRIVHYMQLVELAPAAAHLEVEARG